MTDDVEIIEEFDIDIFKDQLSLVALENELLNMEQVETTLEHSFSPGIYVRQLFIPAGALIIGKRHRYETCNMLLKGELSLYMGPNRPAKKISAPCVFNSKPLVKKMGYAHTDVIFANVHPTNETDLEKIEEEFIITEEEYDALEIEHEGGQKCLG